MSLEGFETHYSRASKHFNGAISTRGRLSLPKNFMIENQIEVKDYYEILYNKATNQFAIKFSEKQTKKAYYKTPQANSNQSMNIELAAFLKSVGFEVEKKVENLYLEYIEGHIVVQLPVPKSVHFMRKVSK